MDGPQMADMLDRLFGGGETSADDTRFRFHVGETVQVKDESPMDDWWAEMWIDRGYGDPRGRRGRILSRRNAYPPPAFDGFWCPIYFVDGIGEIGEDALAAAEE